jgi:SAM-dependent methyltransferase
MYSDAELGALYPADYYAYQDHFQPKKWTQSLKRMLGFYFSAKDPRFDHPGTVLDVGCGSGWFLEEMRARGWTTYGVEINKAAAMLGQESKGLDIFAGKVQDARFSADFFDYIRSNHSFEHITCPNETLGELRRILKPNGKLLVAVPNIDSINARLFKQYWWNLAIPVHAFNYSARTLYRLLEKHQFHVETVRYNSDYLGIIGSFQIWLNRHTSKMALQGRIVNSRPLSVLAQWAATLADIIGQGDMVEIVARRADGFGQ